MKHWIVPCVIGLVGVGIMLLFYVVTEPLTVVPAPALTHAPALPAPHQPTVVRPQPTHEVGGVGPATTMTFYIVEAAFQEPFTPVEGVELRLSTDDAAIVEIHTWSKEDGKAIIGPVSGAYVYLDTASQDHQTITVAPNTQDQRLRIGIDHAAPREVLLMYDEATQSLFMAPNETFSGTDSADAPEE